MSAAAMRLEKFRGAFFSAWRWWLDEMPVGLRQAFAGPARVIFIDVLESHVRIWRQGTDGDGQIADLPRADFDAERLRAVLGPALGKRGLARELFAVRFADSAFLTRSLTFPLTARGRLKDILRFELDRQSPIDSALVYYDYRIAARASDQITVVLRIVRRDAIDPALAVCRAAGVPVASIASIADAGPARGGDFPVDARASLLLALRKRLVAGLALLALLLAVMFLTAVYLRGAFIADQFAAEAGQARAQAEVTLHLRRKIALARDTGLRLVAQKKHPLLVELLAETTRLLPDGSWLTQFEYQGDEIRIQGFSHSAAALIATIDASALFANAQFRAPLLQGAAPGVERFDIAFKLRKAGP